MGKTSTSNKTPAKDGSMTSSNVASAGAPSQIKAPMIRPGKGPFPAPKIYKKDKRKEKKEGDPVSVSTGEVVAEELDLHLGGEVLPIALIRYLASGRCYEPGPLGKGGWTHSFHQWIRHQDGQLILREEDGSEVPFAPCAVHQSAFHRGKGLILTRLGQQHYQVYDQQSGLIRDYRPAVPDSEPRLCFIRDKWNNKVELVYEQGRLSTITDSANRQIRFTYDAQDRITRAEIWVQNKPLQAVHYAYSEDGDLQSASDALGHSEQYQYNGHHKIKQKTLKNGYRFHYQYDPDTGRCVRSWGDGGLWNLELTYDLQAGSTVAHGNPSPRIYHWNAQGAITREQSLDGSFSQAMTYDPDLLLLSQENAAGEKYAFVYDQEGNRIEMTDPGGNVFRWKVKQGQILQDIGPAGLITEYFYDECGGLIAVRPPHGSTAHIVRDALGRITAFEDDQGQRWSLAYDDCHNIVEMTECETRVSRYGYDAFGRLTSKTDALGAVTRIEYDPMGRITRVIYPDGSFWERVYDSMGNVVQERDASGAVWTMQYAAASMLVSQKGPEGQWRYVYDKNEQLITIINPKAETYEFRYDAVGRVIEERSFDGRSIRYQYSRSGRISRIDQPDGTWRAFAFSPLGHLLAEDSSHGTRLFERDSTGQLLRTLVEEGPERIEVLFERDSYGRLLSTTQRGHTIRYEYGPSGQLLSRALPSGEVTGYQYDRWGLKAVQHQGMQMVLGRDALGQESQRSYLAGQLTIDWTYDTMGRVRSQKVQKKAQDSSLLMLVSRAWNYDLRGYPVQIDDARWGQSRYQYDPAGELLGAYDSVDQEVFELDAGASIQDRRVLPQPSQSPWAIAAGNRLLRTPSAEYRYDANGRRIQKRELSSYRETGRVTEYLWDCRDQLREVRFASGARVQYFYDAHGRRLYKQLFAPPSQDPLQAPEPPRVVEYVWDGNVVAEEFDSDKGKRVYVHKPSSFELVFHQEQNEVYICVNDPWGVLKELINAQGEVALSTLHRPFGELKSIDSETAANAQGLPQNPYRLLGQYEDEESGLCYVRFRYFDKDVGRYLSTDPLGIDGGVNLFALEGSPTVVLDPLGLQGTQVPYGSDPLSPYVSAYRQESAAAGNPVGDRNVAAVLYRDPATGEQRVMVASSQGMYAHSEGVLLNELARLGVSPNDVRAVYTELQPCAGDGQRGCRGQLEANCPKAKVTYSFEYPPGGTGKPGARGRAAGRQAQKEQIRADKAKAKVKKAV